MAPGVRIPPGDTTHDAIYPHARDHAFHPVRDYLNGLRWDGIDSVGTWLYAYFGAEKNDYAQGIGRMFLIGMVASVIPAAACQREHAGLAHIKPLSSAGAFKETAYVEITKH